MNNQFCPQKFPLTGSHFYNPFSFLRRRRRSTSSRSPSIKKLSLFPKYSLPLRPTANTTNNETPHSPLRVNNTNSINSSIPSSAKLCPTCHQPLKHRFRRKCCFCLPRYTCRTIIIILSTFLFINWRWNLNLHAAIKPHMNQIEQELMTLSPLSDPVDRPGKKAFAEGVRSSKPVVMIPGIISTGLELFAGEECARNYFRQRWWSSATMIRSIFADSRCWLRHLMLNPKTGMDPTPGIKLRAATGLEAADYFIGPFWIWSRIITNLADIGYDSNNLFLAAYDWRLGFKQLQLRDFYFTKLKMTIEIAKKSNGNQKVVIINHSMGGIVLLYFLKWVESESGGNAGLNWVSENIDSIYSVGAPYLGCPKAFAALFSGEMRDIAELNDYIAYWYQKEKLLFTQTDIVLVMRSLYSIASMLPRGGNAVWGDEQGAPDDMRCEYFKREFFNKNSNNKIGKMNSSTCVPTIDQDRLQWWQKTIPKYKSLFGNRRGSFLTFTSQHFEKYQNYTIPTEMTYEQSLQFLRDIAPEYMNFSDSIYSFTSTTDPETTKNEQRYWSNPLEISLPNAPNLTFYCAYGVGRDTERGYIYQHLNRDISRNNTLTPHFRINSSHIDESVAIRKGVKLSDGDGTVPLISLGYMCAHGWRKDKRLNPYGVKVVNREFIEKNTTQTPIPLMRTSTSSDHVDLIGNYDLIEDIINIVGIQNLTAAESKARNYDKSQLEQHKKRIEDLEESKLQKNDKKSYWDKQSDEQTFNRKIDQNDPFNDKIDHNNPSHQHFQLGSKSTSIETSHEVTSIERELSRWKGSEIDTTKLIESSEELKYTKYRVQDRIYSCIMEMSENVAKRLEIQTNEFMRRIGKPGKTA